MSASRRAVVGLGLALLLRPSALFAAPHTQTLFVIARSKNANVLHYDVRLEDGKLDLGEPMVAYWVMHAEDGRRESLTFLERELAYGFRIVSRVTADGFRVGLKAFSRREFAVRRNADGTYRAHVRIDGQKAVLDRIFVTSQGGGVTPSVKCVDLFGTLASGKKIHERLVP
jgi:hypothetical protein